MLIAPIRSDFDNEEDYILACEAWDDAMDSFIMWAEEDYCERNYRN